MYKCISVEYVSLSRNMTMCWYVSLAKVPWKILKHVGKELVDHGKVGDFKLFLLADDLGERFQGEIKMRVSTACVGGPSRDVKVRLIWRSLWRHHPRGYSGVSCQECVIPRGNMSAAARLILKCLRFVKI